MYIHKFGTSYDISLKKLNFVTTSYLSVLTVNVTWQQSKGGRDHQNSVLRNALTFCFHYLCPFLVLHIFLVMGIVRCFYN